MNQTYKTWDNLTLPEKSSFIGIAAKRGFTDIDTIKNFYKELFEAPLISTIEDTIVDKQVQYNRPIYRNVFADGGYLGKAKALIKENESFSELPYTDAPNGKTWQSVGWGFNDSGFSDKYPEGISKHYKNGITTEQAESELNWYLARADKHLKSVYGPVWDSLDDNKKAAIMDTYYQRPASVLNGSKFYDSFMAGDENAVNNLGVKGYDKRNTYRQNVYSNTQRAIYEQLPELFRNAGLDIIVTSGLREPGKAGKAGNKSKHVIGEAVDIIPNGNTTWEDIEKTIYTNPNIINYMVRNGIGMLDETDRTPEGSMLKKVTGATGNHFHFGTDKLAKEAYASKVGGYIPTLSSYNSMDFKEENAKADLASAYGLRYMYKPHKSQEVKFPNKIKKGTYRMSNNVNIGKSQSQMMNGAIGLLGKEGDLINQTPYIGNIFEFLYSKKKGR